MIISYCEIETIFDVINFISKKYINSPLNVEKTNDDYYLITFESNKQIPENLHYILVDEFYPMLYDVNCYQDKEALPYNIWVIKIMFK